VSGVVPPAPIVMAMTTASPVILPSNLPFIRFSPLSLISPAVPARRRCRPRRS
jgi:hypothetical protein